MVGVRNVECDVVYACSEVEVERRVLRARARRRVAKAVDDPPRVDEPSGVAPGHMRGEHDVVQVARAAGDDVERAGERTGVELVATRVRRAVEDARMAVKVVRAGHPVQHDARVVRAAERRTPVAVKRIREQRVRRRVVRPVKQRNRHYALGHKSLRARTRPVHRPARAGVVPDNRVPHRH